MKYFDPIIQFNDVTAAIAMTENRPKKIEYIYIYKSITGNEIQDLSYTVDLTSRKLKDILQNDISLLLFSDRLKKTVEKEKLKGMSFFKVKINANQEGFTPYWYAHLEYLPEGSLDIKAADGEIKDYHGTKIYSYIKPVLRQKLLEEFNLDYFRIPENEPAEFVSERFKDMFEENKFTGIEFLPVRTI